VLKTRVRGADGPNKAPDFGGSIVAPIPGVVKRPSRPGCAPTGDGPGGPDAAPRYGRPPAPDRTTRSARNRKTCGEQPEDRLKGTARRRTPGRGGITRPRYGCQQAEWPPLAVNRGVGTGPTGRPVAAPRVSLVTAHRGGHPAGWAGTEIDPSHGVGLGGGAPYRTTHRRWDPPSRCTGSARWPGAAPPKPFTDPGCRTSGADVRPATARPAALALLCGGA
jgi:hypothetical protein